VHIYGGSDKGLKVRKNAPLEVIGVRMNFRVVRHDYIHHLTAIRAYKSFVPLPYGVYSRWGWNPIFQVQGVTMIFAVHLVLESRAGVTGTHYVWFSTPSHPPPLS